MYEQMRVRRALSLETGKKVWLVLDDEGCIAVKPDLEAASAVVREVDGADAPVRVEREDAGDAQSV